MADDEIVAMRVDGEFALNAANPAPEWQHAVPAIFHTDWRGQNPEPARETDPAGFMLNASLISQAFDNLSLGIAPIVTVSRVASIATASRSKGWRSRACTNE